MSMGIYSKCLCVLSHLNFTSPPQDGYHYYYLSFYKRKLRPKEVKLFAKEEDDSNSNPQNLSSDPMFVTTNLYRYYTGLIMIPSQNLPR